MMIKRNFVYRDFNRTIEDDKKLNVIPRLSETTVAIEIYHPIKDYVIGWSIRPMYE